MALGDIVYRGASLWKRLVGNTTTTKKVLTQTGDGANSAAPAWDTLAIDDLSDVTITSPSAGDALIYNGSAWVNDTAGTASALDDLTDVVISSPATNDVLKYNGTNWVNGTGGGSGPTIVRKTSDESVTSSTAVQDDDELTFAIGANEIWAAQFHIAYSASSSGDIKFAFSVPSGATGRLQSIGTATTGAVTGNVTSFSTTDLADTGALGFAYGGGNAVDSTLVVSLVVVNGSNAGSVVFRWAQLASNGTATIVRANSFLIAHQIA